MLPAYFIAIAVALRLASGASYLRATWQGKAQPSIVSWSFWSLTALIAFTVQLLNGTGPEAFVTLAIGLSPLAVCLVAWRKGAYKRSLSRSDKWCIVLTILGIILWLMSKNPIAALYLSILADIFSNIPTILKSYRAPHTENATAYGLSAASMVITLLTITDWQLTSWLFAAYILTINSVHVINITVLSRLGDIRLSARKWAWSPIRIRRDDY